MRNRSVISLLLLLIIMFSVIFCSKIVDETFIEKYTYINKSGHDITLKSYKSAKEYTFPLAKENSLTQQINLMFGSASDIISLSDSVTIIFDNKKIQHFTTNTTSIRNFLNPKNFILLLETKNSREYKFIFIEEDYNNAVDLQQHNK